MSLRKKTWVFLVRKKATGGSTVGFKSMSVNPCQPEWAKILTPEGIREFGGLNVGDTIWSKGGWTKVVNKWSTGKNKVFRYSFGWSKDNIVGVFEGTSNHKILSGGIKKEVGKSENCDCLLFGIPNPELNHENGNNYEWYVNSSVPLQNIEFVSEEETFDITVDNESHTYWTNGCVVSNCAEFVLAEYDDKHSCQ